MFSYWVMGCIKGANSKIVAVVDGSAIIWQRSEQDAPASSGGDRHNIFLEALILTS
jgi:hypothetical protein